MEKKKLNGVDDNTVVHSPTEELANQVLRIAHEHGYLWSSGKSFTEESEYDYYKANTCYNLIKGEYSPKSFYERESCKVITAEEFIKLNTTKLTTVTGEQLGAVYLKKEGLDIERFKRLVSGMKWHSDDMKRHLSDGSIYIENWFSFGEVRWSTTDVVEDNSKLITLDELEEMLFPSFTLPEKWCIVVTEDSKHIIHDWKIKNTWCKSFSEVGEVVYSEGTNSPKSYISGSGSTEITFEQFKTHVLKQNEIKMEKKFKVGDKVKVIRNGATYTTHGDKFEELRFKNQKFNPSWKNGEVGTVFVVGRTETGVCGIRHADGKECLIAFYGIEHTTEETKPTITYPVTREQLQSIYDIACSGWKTKIEKLTQDTLGSFGSEGQLTEETVQSMRDACTSEQRPVIDRIFPMPKKLVKKTIVKYEAVNHNDFKGVTATEMKDTAEAVSVTISYPYVAKITIEYEVEE